MIGFSNNTHINILLDFIYPFVYVCTHTECVKSHLNFKGTINILLERKKKQKKKTIQ